MKQYCFVKFYTIPFRSIGDKVGDSYKDKIQAGKYAYKSICVNIFNVLCPQQSADFDSQINTCIFAYWAFPPFCSIDNPLTSLPPLTSSPINLYLPLKLSSSVASSETDFCEALPLDWHNFLSGTTCILTYC